MDWEKQQKLTKVTSEIMCLIYLMKLYKPKLKYNSSQVYYIKKMPPSRLL